MSTPFEIIWTDVSNNVLGVSWFPIGYPATISMPQQLQAHTNAATLQTFETLENVKFFLTGDPDSVDIVQNIWPTLGGSSRPDLNGGYDISFDYGRTYIRFDSTHGVEGSPATWISLPAEAVGAQGADGTLGAFDTAHFIVRVVIPPGADQYGELNISLGIDFDII